VLFYFLFYFFVFFENFVVMLARDIDTGYSILDARYFLLDT